METTLINGIQWCDTTGRSIQAHGGCMISSGSAWFWLGENRNTDDSFRAVSMYRSIDLVAWEFVGDVLSMESAPELHHCNVERPKVVFNQNTGRYVMWMHWENGKDYSEAKCAVASCDKIDGNYQFHGCFRPLETSAGVIDHGKPGYMSRDCSLFVDDDGSGYFISAANENADLHLYRLTSDYLGVETLAAVLFKGGKREAPAIFKRKHVYFLLTSGTSGWKPNQAMYTTSTSLFEGWSPLTPVGDATTFGSQAACVVDLSRGSQSEFLYMGDRWAGAWKGKVNASSYVWLPLCFPSDSTLGMIWASNLCVCHGHVRRSSEDCVVFKSAKSRLYLSVAGSATNLGAKVVQSGLPGASDPFWRLNYNEKGFFRLMNRHGGTVICPHQESESSGVGIEITHNWNRDPQLWTVHCCGKGRYRVQNKKSGLFLGVSSSRDSLQVQQLDATEEDTVIWLIESSASTRLTRGKVASSFKMEQGALRSGKAGNAFSTPSRGFLCLLLLSLFVSMLGLQLRGAFSNYTVVA